MNGPNVRLFRSTFPSLPLLEVATPRIGPLRMRGPATAMPKSYEADDVPKDHAGALRRFNNAEGGTAGLVLQQARPARLRRGSSASQTGGGMPPWCLLNGDLIHVSQVPSGLVPDGRCIECGGRVVAKKGPLLAHHFSHAAEDRVCGISLESVLHKRGKTAVERVIAAHGLKGLIPEPVIWSTPIKDFERFLFGSETLPHPAVAPIAYDVYVEPNDAILPSVDRTVQEVRHPMGFQYDVTAAPAEDCWWAFNVGIEVVVSHDLTADKLARIMTTPDTVIRVDIGDAADDISDADLDALVRKRAEIICQAFTTPSGALWKQALRLTRGGAFSITQESDRHLLLYPC